MAANDVGILRFLSATVQPNWILNVSASGDPWLLIRYHVKLSFSVCLTYLICSIPNALLPLISRNQLGWGHLSAGSHLGRLQSRRLHTWSDPFVPFLGSRGITGLSCQTGDRRLIKRPLLSCFSLSCLDPYHFHLSGSRDIWGTNFCYFIFLNGISIGEKLINV